MNAKLFIREMNRMCAYYDEQCSRCPGYGTCCTEGPMKEEFVDILEKWAEKHPPKTNRDKMRETFGYIPLISLEYLPKAKVQCGDKELSYSDWLQEEYKEPKKSNKL